MGLVYDYVVNKSSLSMTPFDAVRTEAHRSVCL
jgi:hypothetical protein